MYENHSVIFAALLSVATACGHPPASPGGRWTGDAFLASGTDRLEIVVDSTGAIAAVTLRSLGLSDAAATRVGSRGDSLAFAAALEGDTLRLLGAVRDGRWRGQLRRGDDTARFDLVRLHRLTEGEWKTLTGSYRADDGRLLGVAPFSEFGPHPMVYEYATGRIAPLYPATPTRFLVGQGLLSPLHPADTLDFSLGAGGKVVGLRLSKRGQPIVEARRLATHDEEVTFANDSVTLAGTLTLPPGDPPHPALVLVHGSNALTRDVFGPWTRFFTAHGFAVLAYDKRGTGASTGDWTRADFPTLAGDVMAGVRFLASRSEIRTDRIGLWGASQAGWIMPIVAARAPAEIAFIVVHAGSGTTVREQGILNLRNELRAGGLPESGVRLGLRYRALDDRVTASGTGWNELHRFYQRHQAENPWLWPPAAEDSWFRPYYRMLMSFDPTGYWRQVRCPALLFFGELDANVPPVESWPPIERALRAGGNRQVTQVVLPRANHLFLEAETGAQHEYPRLNRFVPGYFDRMAAWLAARTH